MGHTANIILSYDCGGITALTLQKCADAYERSGHSVIAEALRQALQRREREAA
jgi:predicted transcriptional regulator